MKCAICGKEIARSINWKTPLCSDKCDEINFWNEIVANKDRHVVINGKCFFIGKTDSLEKGFGGGRFTIKMKATGEIIKTDNLWSQGEIPQEFRDRLPDTAEFVK